MARSKSAAGMATCAGIVALERSTDVVTAMGVGSLPGPFSDRHDTADVRAPRL